MSIDVPSNGYSRARTDSDDPVWLEPLIREARARVVAAERDRRHDVGEDVRVLLADACRQAQCDGISAERLIVLVKREWIAAHDGDFYARAEAQGALNLLVSACIEAYFAAPRRKNV